MSENYIKTKFNDIKKYANVIEERKEDDISLETVLVGNKQALELAKKHNVNYILIDDNYEMDSDLYNS